MALWEAWLAEGFEGCIGAFQGVFDMRRTERQEGLKGSTGEGTARGVCGWSSRRV